MTKFVALLRGINVGGHKKIKMADLKEVAGKCGLSDVQHYVQSGNLVFSGKGTPDAVAGKLEKACERTFGFPVDIMVLSEDEFRQEVAACPFADGSSPKGELDPKFLQLAFLKGMPDSAHIEALFEAYEGPEMVRLVGRTIHIYFTEGSGRSKLTPLLTDKKLGVPATARNWNTVQKLLAMLDD
ncbi:MULTISPECIES: DUF1697 domain-containing protein [Kordiimonas]|jgi:uncharacterized protein (DUF1697 family)|uniref:DUF1697 domain-containing protein n=1 Tax=Kordiimonas TaxID=288021 RepID=UPI00257BA744|nr:DUF1697 domain-containing protein [Kordiimonas sp. UBA4487]